MEKVTYTPEELLAAAKRLRDHAEQNEHSYPLAREAFMCAQHVACDPSLTPEYVAAAENHARHLAANAALRASIAADAHEPVIDPVPLERREVLDDADAKADLEGKPRPRRNKSR